MEKEENRLEKLTKKEWRIMAVLVNAMFDWESTEKATTKELIDLVKALGRIN